MKPELYEVGTSIAQTKLGISQPLGHWSTMSTIGSPRVSLAASEDGPETDLLKEGCRVLRDALGGYLGGQSIKSKRLFALNDPLHEHVVRRNATGRLCASWPSCSTAPKAQLGNVTRRASLRSSRSKLEAPFIHITTYGSPIVLLLFVSLTCLIPFCHSPFR